LIASPKHPQSVHLIEICRKKGQKKVKNKIIKAKSPKLVNRLFTPKISINTKTYFPLPRKDRRVQRKKLKEAFEKTQLISFAPNTSKYSSNLDGGFPTGSLTLSILKIISHATKIRMTQRNPSLIMVTIV